MPNKMQKTKITANYKVKEPINNFKIRVKIVQQRPLLVELLENEGDTRDSNFLEEEDRIFNWQEKVFSPFEISFYSEKTNCLSECQKEYYQQIKEKNIQGSQLYTYTQSDSYYAEKELLTKPYKTKLVIRNQTALPTLQNRKPFPERYNKTVVDDAPNDARIRTNHYLYMESSVMYVMVDLSQRDKILTSFNEDVETVLCTITYDKLHKILSVNPDFTNDRYYTIANSSGIQFNYWIEHVSGKPSSLELQQQQNESRWKIEQQLMYKAAEISHGLQLLSPNTHKFFIKLDILSAHDFFFDGLCVSYQFDLPELWSTNQSDRLCGRTQRCNLKNNSAYFSYATEILYHLIAGSEGYSAVPLPVLPGSYKFKITTWRPAGSIINSLRRYFTGGTYELEDITYCSIPKVYEDKILNKSQLNVTSSGYIKLNINIIHKTHSSIKDSDQIDYFQKLNTNKLMTNVENVFEQFKTARERMLQIRSLNI
ncbi:Tectonic-like complex member MKS1 [Anthophora quadrimaculata]